jgi:hypothetical protein
VCKIVSVYETGHRLVLKKLFEEEPNVLSLDNTYETEFNFGFDF